MQQDAFGSRSFALIAMRELFNAVKGLEELADQAQATAVPTPQCKVLAIFYFEKLLTPSYIASPDPDSE